jgi:phage-related protein
MSDANQVTVEFFTTPSGQCPPLDYLRSLAKDQRHLVGGEIDKMRRSGIFAPGLKIKIHTGKMLQMTVSYHRLLMVALPNNVVCIVHAFQKETDQTDKLNKAVGLKRTAIVLARK